MIQWQPLLYFITIGFTLVSMCGTESADCVGQLTRIEIDVEQTEFLKNGFMTEQGLKSYFGSMTEDQLRFAQFSKEQVISVNAAWLLCKARHHQLNARRFLGKKRIKQESVSLKREYLGFISGKLNIEIPVWWSDALINCPVDNRLPMKNYLALSYGFSETFGVAHRKDVKLTRVNENDFSGIVNGHEFNVKVEPDKDESWYTGCIRTLDVTVKGDGHVFVAVTHENDFWVKVICYGNMGNTVWTSESRDRAVGNIDVSPVTVELKISEDNLYLFGACSTDIFCEVFSTNNGLCINRFSTLRTNNLPLLDGLPEIGENW